MFPQIELVSLGLATVIDTVLLLALAERCNRARVAVPIVALVCGAVLLHGGAFARTLLFDLTGTWAPLPLHHHARRSACVFDRASIRVLTAGRHEEKPHPDGNRRRQRCRHIPCAVAWEVFRTDRYAQQLRADEDIARVCRA